MNDHTTFERLLRLGHPCLAVVTVEENHVLSIVRDIVGGSLNPLWAWTCTRGLVDALATNKEPVADTNHPAAALYHLAHQQVGRQVAVMLDLGAHLDDAGTLRALRDAIHVFRDRGGTLILVDHTDRLPDVVAGESTPVELHPPDEAELEEIVKDVLRRMQNEHDVKIELKKRELAVIVRNLRGLSRRIARRIITDMAQEDSRFDEDDVNEVLAEKRRRLSGAGVLEYVEAPTDLDDVGGLVHLKSWLLRRKDTMSAKARDFGIASPRGVLLLGVQGAGKSLSAKAIATAFGYPLLRLDPGTLYDRYVGASEQRLREALRQAESMAPIVLWIDEIEKGFASAAAQSTDGGLSQRMFGTLLTWMQDHDAPVFLVATANNIEALPPELLRKGRFDEIFFVDLPNEDVRRKITAIHLERRDRDPDHFDLAHIASVSNGYSGAEIEQAVISALYDAFAKSEALSTEHIVGALETSPPLSVTMAERLAKLRAWAEGRAVPAG